MLLWMVSGSVALMVMVMVVEGYRGEGGVVAVSNSGIWIYNFETWDGPGW